jgi:serine/threonine-protein kinase
VDPVAQLKTALAGRYEIEHEIGAGGMATVYLARDVKHDRNVAVKVLNPELGAVLGVERFLSEIKVTANLQHPNLLPLFDSGEAGGLLFYVMPFVEGESLRATLTREKQLPIDEAVHITTAIASALEYAHKHGVIHRDLKPENILIHAGQPVIADFGIALAVSKAGGERITQTGLSLGTPHYMSPEQATGDRAIDGRTDIYSLGAMLFEMLTGDPPFTGSTAQAIIAKTLTERPPRVSVRREMVPEHIDFAVEKALTKLPADRWSTAHQFAEALTGGALGSAMRTAPGTAQSRQMPGARAEAGASRSPLTVALGGALVVALAALAWSLTTRSAAPALGTASFEITLRGGLRVGQQTGVSLAFAPDGRSIVYVASRALKFQLYRRTLDDLESKPLAGTEDGLRPAISPDSKWVAFYGGGKIRKVPIEGGTSTPIAEGTVEWGMTWAKSDVLVLANTGKWAGLSRVSAGGGTPETLTTPDTANGEAHVWPTALPDGDNVLFTVWPRSGLQGAKLAVASLKSGRAYPLDVPGSYALGVFEGRLVYARADGALMAVPFDVGAHKVTGSPIAVLDTVIVEGNGVARVAVSQTGWLAYLIGGSAATIALVDEHGNARTVLAEPRPYEFARLSPDGRRIAVAVSSAQGTDVWMHDFASKTFEKFTSGGANRVEWTPDGRRVSFRATHGGHTGWWWQPVDLSAPASKLFELASGAVDEGIITPDNKYFVYRTLNAGTRRDIFFAPMDSLTKSRPLMNGPADEYMPRVSQDGKWIAYVSDESLTPEVYVRPFPAATSRTLISSGGGTEPMWSPDGRTLYYRTERQLVAVTLSFSPSLTVVDRKPLFEGNYALGTIHQAYDVSHDGKSFLMLQRLDNGTQAVIVTNWLEVMRRKVAGQKGAQ